VPREGEHADRLVMQLRVLQRVQGAEHRLVDLLSATRGWVQGAQAVRLRFWTHVGSPRSAPSSVPRGERATCFEAVMGVRVRVRC